ncbi:hypothetical protein [Streptomyces sulphureus]|uniref:hypothetical protein n=1 Tax=Streptomyces sulphureus TaxID=47758 RepID=UPI0003691323|nr:hypothetical protein [Streptomyces sulphureus]
MTAPGRLQPTASDRRLHRIMNDPRTKPYHATAGRRRALVLAHTAATAAGFTGLVVLYAAHNAWWAALIAAALLVWVPLTGLLNSMTDGLFELRPRMLDERQLAERAAVHGLAFRVVRLVVLAAVLAFAGLAATGIALADLAGALAGTGVGLLLLQGLLPLWLAAVRVEDVPADEVAA